MSIGFPEKVQKILDFPVFSGIFRSHHIRRGQNHRDREPASFDRRPVKSRRDRRKEVGHHL